MSCWPCSQMKVETAKQAYYQVARDVLWFRDWPEPKQQHYLRSLTCPPRMKKLLRGRFCSLNPLESCQTITSNYTVPFCERLVYTMGVHNLLWAFAFCDVVTELREEFQQSHCHIAVNLPLVAPFNMVNCSREHLRASAWSSISAKARPRCCGPSLR